jgi:hypothetical protein
VICSACLADSRLGAFVRVLPFDPAEAQTVAPLCVECSELPDAEVTQKALERLFDCLQFLGTAGGA